jgi:hypothetical protein
MYKVVLSLAFLLTAVLIHYKDESTGLEMKTYSYQYASEGRELRRGGRSRSSRSSYRSSYGRSYSGSSYKSPTYGSSYYIPLAMRYTYAVGYYMNRPNMECLIEDYECIEEYKAHNSLVTGISAGIGVTVIVAAVGSTIYMHILKRKEEREKYEKYLAAQQAAQAQLLP